MAYALDVTGERFGRLTAIRRGKTGPNRAVYWICQCDCGNTKEVALGNLKRGFVKSCGCLRKDNMASVTHGMSDTRIYHVYQDIKARCYNEKSNSYNNYGGRGIRMCDEWLRDPSSFIAWAYTNGFDENAPRGVCTIDRINTDGNYEPSNCRWIDAREQANNRRTNVYIEFDGETHTLTEWAEITGIGRTTLSNRLKMGWTIERTLTEQPKSLKRKEMD